MSRIPPWLFLGLLGSVAGFTFNTSVPTQCEDFTVQWYVRFVAVADVTPADDKGWG